MSPVRRIRLLDIRTAALLALIALAALSPSTISSHAATSANLSVASSTNVFLASTNSTLMLEITNVGKYLKELDVAITLPSVVVLFGDNHWTRSSFAHEDTIRANLTVFAPSSVAGATIQGSIIAVYKVAGETTPSTETHAISFLVRGWIDLTVYEITVDPDPALPGSEITISGNILNRGVIPAMYTNVTIAAEPPLVKDSVKPTYVGEVDPNAPAPFSVTVVVDSGATEGSYRTTILAYYRDDLQLDHAVAVPVSFTVVLELSKTETTKNTVRIASEIHPILQLRTPTHGTKLFNTSRSLLRRCAKCPVITHATGFKSKGQERGEREPLRVEGKEDSNCNDVCRDRNQREGRHHHLQ